jgi:DNA-directed RNA polymerase subunit RPC12/RpoP
MGFSEEELWGVESAKAQVDVNEIERRFAGSEIESLRDFLQGRCMSCNKEFRFFETKVLPTEYIQGKDYFVRKGIVEKRYLCVDCHNRMASRIRDRYRGGNGSY